MNTTTAALLLASTLGMSGCAVGLGLVDVGSARTSSSQVITGARKVGTTSYEADIYEISTGTMSMSGGGFGMMTGVHAGHHFSSLGDDSGSGWIVDTLLETVFSSGWWGFGIRFDAMVRLGDLEYNALPLTGHFYVGGDRVSGHIGAGVDLSETSVIRLMTGIRFAISSDGATLLVFDIDHMRGGDDTDAYSSTGLIIGLAFLQ